MESLGPLLIIGILVFIVVSIDFVLNKINKPKEILKNIITRSEKEINKKNQEIEDLNRKLEISNTKINSLIESINFEKKTINDLNLNIEVQKQNINKDQGQKANQLKLLEEKILELEQINEQTKSRYEKELSFLKEGIKKKDELYQQLKSQPEIALTKITSLITDFNLIQFDLSSKYLKEKKHPAFSEALRVNNLRAEAKIVTEKYKQMLYKYEYLMQIFPELTKYADDFNTILTLENSSNLSSFLENYDKVSDFLSKEEYSKLSIDQRNQLALDRYIKGQKSNWQIGRDYELFCGLEYQKSGWQVTFFGMEKKLEDMGRDLIAIRNTEHHIIQCKYWSKQKVIHEKHITQLYGSAIEYSMNRNDNPFVLPVFITNTVLSDKARKFAKKLGVVVKENKELGDFPRIKCNLNKDQYGAHTKIYHLPFDQQYDKTRIEYPGEFYAYTINEAVEKGFRRAYKYFG